MSKISVKERLLPEKAFFLSGIEFANLKENKSVVRI